MASFHMDSFIYERPSSTAAGLNFGEAWKALRSICTLRLGLSSRCEMILAASKKLVADRCRLFVKRA
ncbi:MAG: hypothetical protein ACYTFG_07310, partial [Planctomycetota bacterium]